MQTAEVVDQYPRPPPYFALFTADNADKILPPTVPINSDELVTYGGTVPKPNLTKGEDCGDEKIALKRYISLHFCRWTIDQVECRLICDFLDASLQFVGGVPNSDTAISERMIELDHKINRVYEFLDKYKYNEVATFANDYFLNWCLCQRRKYH